MATVQIDLSELDEIRARERKAIDELAQLQQQMVLVKRGDPGGRIERLEVLARNLIDVMRFAVGNLPPETTRNWPRAKLNAIALDLKYLPDYGSDDITLESELRIFVREIERFDEERRLKAASAR